MPQLLKSPDPTAAAPKRWLRVRQAAIVLSRPQAGDNFFTKRPDRDTKSIRTIFSIRNIKSPEMRIRYGFLVVGVGVGFGAGGVTVGFGCPAPGGTNQISTTAGSRL